MSALVPDTTWRFDNLDALNQYLTLKILPYSKPIETG